MERFISVLLRENEQTAALKRGAERVFIDRIRSAPADLIQTITKSPAAEGRLWDFGTHVLYSVTAPKSLHQFERFKSKYGHPFPKLLRRGTEPVMFSLHGVNTSFGKMTLNMKEASVVEMLPDTTMWFYNVRIIGTTGGQPVDYRIELVFVIRYGKTILRSMTTEVLDSLIVKHINQTSGYDLAYV